MSERLRNTSIVVAIAVMAVLLGFMITSQPSEVDRVQSIGTRIKCPQCQGESIADSPAQIAQDMMALVEERVDAGESDLQIITELLASYTGAVLLDPPTSGNTLILWLAPVFAVGVGVFVIVWWKRHPGEEHPEAEPQTRSRSRLVFGGIALLASFAVVVVVATNSLQNRDPTASGVADIEASELESVSNETMEAVVAANLDDPAINGMRIALAERYFEINDYSGAFPHYLAVAESPDATAPELVTSLIRLGWMAYDGNGEVDAAINLLDQALEIEPDSHLGLYLKGQIVWCGRGDEDAAADLFSEVLADPGLPEDSRIQVQSDLDQALSGASCT